MQKDKFVTVEQAAQTLGLHVQSVRKLIHSGKLPAFQISSEGRGFLIKPEDLAKLKAERDAPKPVVSTKK